MFLQGCVFPAPGYPTLHSLPIRMQLRQVRACFARQHAREFLLGVGADQCVWFRIKEANRCHSNSGYCACYQLLCSASVWLMLRYFVADAMGAVAPHKPSLGTESTGTLRDCLPPCSRS